MMKVIKRDKTKQDFIPDKIFKAIEKAYKSVGDGIPYDIFYIMGQDYERKQGYFASIMDKDEVTVEEIQDIVERYLKDIAPYKVMKAYILYREKHKNIRGWANKKVQFIENYKQSDNTANATIDDNSNVNSKNIGILNSELHKEDNIAVNRYMVTSKLKELYPDFDEKNYIKDLEHHIIYKHDESSFCGISPYCCSITMYPFLLNGLKDIGGLSTAPKNLDSFCGMYINLIFAVSSMFAGACATSEVLLYFTYYCKKEWGEDFWQHPDRIISQNSNREKTIKKQIHQYWQQLIYSINQPAAARGMQSAFVNFSYFDKPFFEGMFGDFVFPDGTRPDWESLNWIQQEFMQWFNQERLRVILTFPVESFCLLYKDGKFVDKENAQFAAEEYARGHSFFTYISDTVDSLSSCCFSKDTKVLWKSSTTGVHCTTLEELHNTKWDPDKKNLRIYHNGSWIKGKSIQLPNRSMYKIILENNQEYIISDNHINVTYNGEIETKDLTTNDYLMFNTKKLYSVKENDEHLSYTEGILLGLFIGDGTYGNYICQDGTPSMFQLSLNESKYKKVKNILDSFGEYKLRTTENNVYSVYFYNNKDLVAFLIRWTGCKPNETYSYNKNLNINCLLQSTEFRQGILDGWYITDGGNSNRCYTISPELAYNMQILITSLGLQSVCDISDRTDEAVIIRGDVYKRNYPLYCVRFYDENNARIRPESGFKWKNNSLYWKIRSIEPIEYTDYIYCIECNNKEEPYFTLPGGLITHNCRLKNKIQTHEFNFTNGNIGIQTGSKSVITLNLNRIIQDWHKYHELGARMKYGDNEISNLSAMELLDRFNFKEYLTRILERVYKYHTAYNELLWDLYNANLLPVYKAGFIDLNKQYLTIGLNGLNEAAEYLGIYCSDNKVYREFCNFIFGTVKEQNELHKTKKTTFNTEQVPAESLAIKNYNWDKEEKYWVPQKRNLYASYVFIPSDPYRSVLEKLKMHGREFIGDFLDGGSSAHIGLDHHLDVEQYKKLLKYAAEVGCQYFTFNIPNSECNDCGFITKVLIQECPKCDSKNITYYDRIIG